MIKIAYPLRRVSRLSILTREKAQTPIIIKNSDAIRLRKHIDGLSAKPPLSNIYVSALLGLDKLAIGSEPPPRVCVVLLRSITITTVSSLQCTAEGYVHQTKLNTLWGWPGTHLPVRVRPKQTSLAYPGTSEDTLEVPATLHRSNRTRTHNLLVVTFVRVQNKEPFSGLRSYY